MTDGILLKIKPGQAAAKPVLVVEARASATPRMANTRHVVAVEKGASLTLVEARIALDGQQRGGQAAGHRVAPCLGFDQPELRIPEFEVFLEMLDENEHALLAIG